MTASSISLPVELDRFRAKLLDLSLRNPLLNYRISKRKTVQIVDEIPDEIYRRLVELEKPMTLAPDPSLDQVVESDQVMGSQMPLPGLIVDDTEASAASERATSRTRERSKRRYTDNQLQTNLGTLPFQSIARGLARDAKTSIEETGINYLHLAMGFLRWHENENNDSDLRMAPLLLIPISIQSTLSPTGGQEFHVAWNQDDVQTNASLKKKLQTDFAIPLPDFEEEQAPSDYFAKVAIAIQSKSRWRIDEQMLLGFFSFHKLSMYMDIDPTHWKESPALGESSLANQLVTGRREVAGSGLYSPDYEVDEHDVAMKITLPLDADSSQQSAIADIAQGKSLVIEGPPGTGKSQTIANSIANAIERGKRVLFVAEKMAALEVVFKRLAQAGLADFCLELHGHAVAPKKVMESLGARLGHERKDPVQKEDAQRRLAECREKLRAYLRASSTPVGPYQEPLYALFWRIVKLRQDGVPVRRDIACNLDLSLEAFEDACEALNAFSKQSETYQQPTQSAWWGYFPRDLAPTEATRILEEIERLAEPAQSFARAVSDLQPLFDNDVQRVQRFLTGKDQSALDLLAQQAPDQPIVPFATLSNASTRQPIERLEKAVRTQTTARQLLDAQLVDGSRDVPTLLASLNQATLQQWGRWAPGMNLDSLRGLHSWIDQTRSLLDVHRHRLEAWQKLGMRDLSRIQDLEKAILIAHLFQHSAVAEQESIGADWFLDTTRTVLGRIKTQHESLAKRKEEISKVFHLASVPDRKVLLELIRQLRASGGSWFAWLNRDYRRVTKELKGFSKFPSGYSFAKRMQALESLESFDKDCQAFETESSSRRILGDLFRGLDTDWERIKTFLDWVATAKKMGLDHSKVNALLKLRSELVLGSGISNLKLDFQQFSGQLASEQAKVAGLDPKTATGLRIQDIEAVLASVTSVVEQSLAFAEQFKDRAHATIRSMLVVYQTAQSYDAAKSEVEELCASQSAEVQIAAEFLCEQGGSFAAVFDWLDRFRSQTQDLELASALDRFGARAVSDKLAALYRTVGNSLQRWTEIRQAVVGTAECQEAWLAASDQGAPRIDLAEKLQRIHSERSRLPAWLAFCRTYERCRRARVEAFAMAAARDEIPESQLCDCFRLSLFHQIAERELGQNAIGFHFTAKEIEDIRVNFQRLDRQSMSSKSIEIDRVARQRHVPEGNGKGRVSEFTELALIRHEIGKKTRHCKIRDLMSRAGNAMQALKPCFLMSPLSLARYVPNNALEFDLVIMDEASQIKPEDAMGAILRARQLVVVGDPKQLPPTSFFDQNEEDIEDEEATQFDNAESVLEVAQRSFQPYRRLRWHYRSQHESLIQFSNRSFYDEDLVVFPSPKGRMAGYGITATYVEGATCVKGENVREAETVVAKIVEHARNRPEESLGVAAFNRKQAELIEGLLDKACDQDADLARLIAQMREGDDGLFIKNLETIQGDERDVIFVSYTYGPDPVSGRVFQRFGPINSDLGWRRLNVMVTRSRKRMEIVSSLHPSDIQYGPDKSRGVNAYHDFLEFAFSGTLREAGSESGREPGSPFEVSVARVVESLGLEPVFQVGVAGFFIDIGVRRREGSREFLLGIECDGASYHSSKSARDRDRLREEIITARGWKIHRIWSTEWFLNQQVEEERLQKVLRSLG